ncbi:MAG: hypothetical protein A2145_05010 [candidate division Zixibacteria bacterium RBG_16_40_9]|nr:MAG: hypothetical protein A2145_05010 [candidate division Zixibacteria bacterium RBG_16_40_9]
MKLRKFTFEIVFVLSFLIFLYHTAFSQNPDSIPFAPAVNYDIDNQPFSVYCADLDGDGDQDLAVSVWGKNVVSIFKNRGDGCFEAKVDYATGSSPHQIFVSDLDADGDSDLAVANYNSRSVSILKNQGDGSFSGRVDYSIGNGPVSLFAADLDQDSDQDVAVADRQYNIIAFFKNLGNGTFWYNGDFNSGASPHSVFASDLDLDTDYDLVIDRGDLFFVDTGSIAIYFNNGDGTFSAGPVYPSGGAPRYLFVSDLDSDTFPDIVVPNNSSGTISIFINNGDGTFADKVDYSVGAKPYAVIAADLDGDGDSDIAVGKENSNAISIFKNNGDGTLASKVDYVTGQNPLLLYAADLDGDGDLDLAVPNQLSKTVSILENLTAIGPPCGQPVILTAPVGDKMVTVTETLSFQVSACGCPEITVLSADSLPANSFFTDFGNGNGVFTFTPDSTQGGIHQVTFSACDTVGCDSQTVQITVLCPIRGDVNGNGGISLGDIIYLTNYVFKGGSAPQYCTGDANHDGKVNLVDIMFLVNRIFRFGPAPFPATCCL